MILRYLRQRVRFAIYYLMPLRGQNLKFSRRSIGCFPAAQSSFEAMVVLTGKYSAGMIMPDYIRFLAR